MKIPKLADYEKKLEQMFNYTFDDTDIDTREFMKLLTYMAARNIKLRGHIKVRKTAISAWDWTITPFDKANAEEAQLAKQRLEPVIRQIISNSVNTDLFGHFCLELKWEFIEGAHTPSVLEIYKPYQLEGFKDGTVGIWKEDTLKKIKPEDQLFVYSNDTEAFIKGGIMSSVGLFEVLRQENVQEWRNFNLKLKGIIQGVHSGADDEEKSAAIQALQKVMKNNYLLTSDLMDFNFHQITAANGSQSFKDFWEKIDNAIAIAVMGQANTTELPKGGGSRAALQILQLISNDIAIADTIQANSIVNEQLLKYDWTRNYGDKPIPYKFEIQVNDIEDNESNANTVGTLLDAGIKLKREEVYNKIGYSIPEEGDDVIEGISV